MPHITTALIISIILFFSNNVSAISESILLI